jgi:hypothetical protein
VDRNGNAHVTGNTRSFNFPTSNAVQPLYGGNGDAFFTKLGSTGAVVYSTYLGGSRGENVRSLVLDSRDNAYLAGGTSSSNFPTANAVQSTFGGGRDIFVTKLDAIGAFVYSTYLGGSGFDLDGTFSEGLLTVDGRGDTYIAGITTSLNFPTVNAVQTEKAGGEDIFVTKLDEVGAFVYSTYLGGSGVDNVQSLAVDSRGNAYVTGNTLSIDFPTANGVQSVSGGGVDAYVLKFSASSEGVIP